MFKLMKKIFCLFIGSLLIISGAFVGVAGIFGGLGAVTLELKLLYLFAGVIVFLFGFWLYYQGSNKNILKVIGDLIEALLLNI